ncbi:MAG TPA: DUF1214 domain-containing protein [Acidimicrobiales bacterium]
MADVPKGFNTPIPAKVMTPDRVETRLGTLEFTDGFPTPGTAEMLYDHLDFVRAVEVFLSCIPAASLEGMRRGMAELGIEHRHQVAIVGNLDARTMFFYLATVNTPAMALKIPGVGSQYALVEHDSHGNHLDGATSYRLTLPPDAPAKDFWSVVAYDPQTRSELQSGQALPSRNSQRDQLRYHDDRSITLTLGPESPEDSQSTWIQTVAGKKWFAILRLYGPLEPWFERTWVPGDIEPI